MKFFPFFFLVAFSCFLCQAIDIKGVSKKDLPLYSGNTFVCKDQSKTIPISYVNDQYCDCEADGSDEPGTSACSMGQFYCRNKGFKGVFIPSSRVNDGLCDCCDGSDELGSRCPDRCADLRREAQKDVLTEIQAIEEGLKVKQQWLEEVQAKKQEKEKEIEELKKELTLKETELESARAWKEQEEALEKAERERIEAARKFEEEKNVNTPVTQDQQSLKDQSPTETSSESPSNSATEAATPLIEAEVEAFPYPQEYAFHQEADAKKDDAESFPYPKEYALPPAQSEAGESVPEPVTPEATKEEIEVETEEPVRAPEPYRSEAADKARRAFDDAERERNRVQKEIERVEQWLKQDYGEKGEFMKLQGQCFSQNVKQYVYEVCPYQKSEQKEGGHGTSLGEFRGFVSPSEITSTTIALDDSFYSKVMKFDGGMHCWNGPSRSMIVMLKCGQTNELSHVEEPSKCVYTGILKTPAVCSIEHAKALKFNLEADSFGGEEEE